MRLARAVLEDVVDADATALPTDDARRHGVLNLMLPRVGHGPTLEPLVAGPECCLRLVEGRRAAGCLHASSARAHDLQGPSPTRGLDRRGAIFVDAADRLGAAVVDVPIILGVRIAGETGRTHGQRHRVEDITRAMVSTQPGRLLEANRKTFARSEPYRL